LGKNDTITPAFVEQFHERLQLRLFIANCGHAPMMELPERFNKILYDFLVEIGE
jgi:pimeloyl-ACP methyl ester carboxylesterase